MPSKANRFDLFTFVASAALSTAQPFPLECNCGGVVTIMPPFQDEYVVCPRCESKIKILVVEGDPGYIIGGDADHNPTLLPVQGSSKLYPSKLAPDEREKILTSAWETIKKMEKADGGPGGTAPSS